MINVANGSVVNQFGSTITGGTINTTGAGKLVAFASASNFLDSVTLNGNLDMATGTGFQRIANGLTLGGTIDLNNNSVLAFQGNNTLAGTGTIVLGNTGASNRIALDGNGTTTFAAGTTVRGENGTIGNAVFVGGVQTLVNNGTISADVAGGTINIAGAAVTNNGTLSALNGGTLLLSSNVTGNPGGQIVAGAGSTVLQNSVTLAGTINTSGGGRFAATASAGNILNGVTLNGNLDLATATGFERVTAGGLVLNGTINLNNSSVLAFEGNGGLSGNGTIVLGSTGSSNRIALDGTGTTTFAASTTVRGENGTIGNAVFAGGAQTLVNNGTISADVSGGTITLSTAPVTNNGTLSALNGGTMLLSSNVTGGALGQIVAGAGSTVLQNAVTLSGVINTSGGGRFAATASGSNFLDGVTLNGNLDLATATSFERVTAGGLVLNGTINLNNSSVLAFNGTGGLSGAGTIVLGNTGSSNRIGLDGTGTTTFAAGTTIRGQNGTIGNAVFVGGTQTLVNNGTISADVSGGTINIAGAAVTNNGTLSALNGGTMLLSSNVTGSATGQIVAGAGSTVLQNAVTLAGTINTSGSGRFAATASGSNFLNGVTLNGNLDLATATAVERVTAGGLVLNGTINLNNNSVLAFEGVGGLSGNGTIVLGSTGGSNRIALDGNGTTTFAAGTTIRGQNGTIGNAVFVGGSQTLVNNGTINADVAGGLITISGAPLVNNGLVRAQAGTMTVSTALTGTGTLQVDATGAMNLAAGAKSQGTLAMGAAGAALNLNTGNLTISSDYTNAGAGSGNAFNRRAGVTGTGQIVAGGNAAQAITGANVTNGNTTNGNTTNATLTIGNVRVGNNTFNYQVANTGTTGPTLRGAIQTNVNGANLSDTRLTGAGVTPSNYNAGAPGGNSGNLGVTFTAAAAGVLAPLAGQVLNLRSNFENIADQKLNIVLGGGAAAFNLAQGSVSPSPTVTVANQRILGNTQAALAVTNTAPAGAFTERLNAGFTANSGDATNNLGTVSLLAAGSSNNTNMSVGVNTATAGAKTGTMTIGFQSDGTGTSGLAAVSAGSQVVTVNGNVYRVAQGQLNTAPLNFGTVQVGQVVSQNLSVSNIATGTAGFVEDLKATFGATSGTGVALISGTGQLTGVQAGQTSNAGNGTMTVNVNTAAAGVVNGAIAVNFITAGAVAGNSNGLGELGVGQASYGVQGNINAVVNVINQASPLVNTPTINLGNVRVNAASPTANVSVTNVAGAPPQAALNANITGNAPITATGSFNLLAPGATNNSSLSVGMNTSTAGAINGTATIAFVSDASNVGGCAPNCQLNLASQNVNVTGAVYRTANAQNVTPSITLASRVGGSASGNVSITNQSPDVFTEALKVQAGVAPGGFSVGANPANISAQATGNLQVNLSTATAGTFVGNLALNHISTGAGTTNAADIGVGSSNVTLNGKVYTAAQATVQPNINFGIVHVGDVVATRGVSVQNSAPVTALNDTLRATIGGATGPFTSSGGPVSGLAAGATDSTTLRVGLNTAAAGVYNSGSASVGLTSQNADMADLALIAQTIALSGQVNNYANALFDKVNGAGTLTRSGNLFTLDFGTVLQGSAALGAIVDVDNFITGPADLLDGSLNVLDGNDFTTLLGNAFADVAAGGSSGNLLQFLFNTAALGTYNDLMDLSWFGHNASGYQDASQLYTLRVTGTVIEANGNNVPEPGTLLLMVIALAGFGASRRRKTA